MDERIVKYQEKMDKTLANLDSEFGTIRAGRANPHVLDQYYGRILRSTDTTAAGSQYLCTGSPDDPDSAVGRISGKRN